MMSHSAYLFWFLIVFSFLTFLFYQKFIWFFKYFISIPFHFFSFFFFEIVFSFWNFSCSCSFYYFFCFFSCCGLVSTIFYLDS